MLSCTKESGREAELWRPPTTRSRHGRIPLPTTATSTPSAFSTARSRPFIPRQGLYLFEHASVEPLNTRKHTLSAKFVCFFDALNTTKESSSLGKSKKNKIASPFRISLSLFCGLLLCEPPLRSELETSVHPRALSFLKKNSHQHLSFPAFVPTLFRAVRCSRRASTCIKLGCMLYGERLCHSALLLSYGILV